MSKMKQKVLWREIKRLNDVIECAERDLTDLTDEIGGVSKRVGNYSEALFYGMNELELLRNKCENDWNNEHIRGTIDTKDMTFELERIINTIKGKVRGEC